MLVVDRQKEVGYKPKLYGEHTDDCEFKLVARRDSFEEYELIVPSERTTKLLSVKWRLKALEVKGAWSSNVVLDKRFRTDWELPQVSSSISIDAPIISLFSHTDQNILAVACSDSTNKIEMEIAFREEDNHFYGAVHFFGSTSSNTDYKTRIRFDYQNIRFNHAIIDATQWIMNTEGINSMSVPYKAKLPLYSTWYSFHQNLDESLLLEECRIAKTLGCELLIIDDGWQTLDAGRGYDYTGDWRPERMGDMKGLASKIHSLGMSVMLWYSVPFCGVKSEAYKRFKGKFLTENHHWAPVFDPRFPEVRSYLVNIYKNALLEWDIDGFKLDFIDDFKIYPETEVKHLNGRDTLSVPQGVLMLIQEIKNELLSVKPEVLIEFRQKYVGPALRQLGNMFRAFDCPNDSVMNRVRTTDIKMICGESAVHSDMLTWHEEEKVEVAALQLTNILFSVPQISVRLAKQSAETIKMIKFYISYWLDNRDILMNPMFNVYKPLNNYPIISSSGDSKSIIALYEDVILTLDASEKEIDIVNGKLTREIILKLDKDYGLFESTTVDCLGNITHNGELKLSEGIVVLSCPPNGIAKLKSKNEV